MSDRQTEIAQMRHARAKAAEQLAEEYRKLDKAMEIVEKQMAICRKVLGVYDRNVHKKPKAA